MQEQTQKPKGKKSYPHPAKIYLKKYAAMKLRYDDLQEELLLIRQKATRATSRMTAERVSGTPMKDGMANAAIKAVETERKLDCTLRNLKEGLAHRSWVIEQMDDEWEKTILTERYIKGLDWDEILPRIPYERSSMYELHGKALNHFWEIHMRSAQSED